MTLDENETQFSGYNFFLKINVIIILFLYFMHSLSHYCFNGDEDVSCVVNYYPEKLARLIPLSPFLTFIVMLLFSLILLIIWNIVVIFHYNAINIISNSGGSYFKEQVKPHYLVLYLAIMYTILFFSGFDKFMPFFSQFNEFAGFMWFHGMVLSFYTLEWKKQQFYDENTENHLDRSYELVKYD